MASQGTITDGLKRLAPLFEPLIEAMNAQQMRESLFFGDETRRMVFETVEGKIGRRWELYRIHKQRLSEWDPEVALEQQSGAFARHHQTLIEALTAMEQRRDEALRQRELPARQRAVLASLKTHWGT
jgi:hypothetical protein